MSSRLDSVADAKPGPVLVPADAVSKAAGDRTARGLLGCALASSTLKSALMITSDAAAGLTVLLSLHMRQRIWWAAAVFQLSILALGGYKPLDRLRPEREFEIFFKSLLISLPFGTAVLPAGTPMRSLLALPLAALAAMMGRTCLRCGFYQLWKHAHGRQRAIVIGGRTALELECLLRVQRYYGLQLLGYVDSSPTAPIPYLGEIEDVPRLLRRLQADMAILSAEQLEGQPATELSRRVEVLVDGKPLNPPWHSSGKHDFLVPVRTRVSPGVAAVHRVSKRLMDIALGSIGCFVTLLLWPAIALAIKLDDGGPVFYRQQYVAAPGKFGTYWKFRSMRVDAAAVLERNAVLRLDFERKFKLQHDPRITRVGRILRRYSLDELPEMFSVVRGTLSLVGPRTLSRAEAPRYGAKLEKLLSVKPGVTGFWQAMGRQTTTPTERIVMDLFYIDHRSPWLDWWIVGRTVWKVISADGAY